MSFARHPFHEVFRRFEGDGRGRGHLQGVTGGGETIAFVGGGQQAVMADALEARRQDVLQETADACPEPVEGKTGPGMRITRLPP